MCVVDNWVPQADVQALRRDVDKLWDAGKFIASKVGSRSVSADGSITDSKTLEEETRRAQTAWLRPPPDPSVGDVDARRKLDGQLESLREKLIENSGAPLLRTMELSYAKSRRRLLPEAHRRAPVRILRAGPERRHGL